MLKKLILQVSIKFVSVACGIFTSRWLVSNIATQEYAQYSLILSYNTIILTGITFGLPSIIQKFFTNSHYEDKLSEFWTTSALLRVISYGVSLLIIALTYRLSQTDDLGLIMLIFSAQFILLADLAYRAVCDSHNRSWQFSLTDLFGKFLLLALLYLLSGYFEANLYLFGFLSVFCYGVQIILDGLWQSKLVKWGRPNFGIIRSEIRSFGYLSFADIINGIYSKTDVLLLAFFSFGAVEIASYSNAYKLFEIASITCGLTMPVVASTIRKKINSKLLTQKNLYKYFGMSLLAGLFIGFGLFVTAPLGVWLIDPEGLYPQSTEILRLLSPVIVLLFPTLLASDLLNVSGLEKQQFITKLATFILAMVVYLILIPSFGAWGASITTIIFFGFECVYKFILINKYLKDSLVR